MSITFWRLIGSIGYLAFTYRGNDDLPLWSRSYEIIDCVSNETNDSTRKAEFPHHHIYVCFIK
jgi:hypothetical protein